MGRPRKPTNLKILEGAQPCRINKNEPSSPEGLGQPPGWLDEVARDAWARLSAQLAPMRVATQADFEAATVYCQAFATWRQALAIVEAEGMIVESTTETTTRNGTVTKTVRKANPLLPTIANSQRQMMQCLTQFGLTPSSRSGLHVETRPGDDKLLSFIARGGNHGQGQKNGNSA